MQSPLRKKLGWRKIYGTHGTQAPYQKPVLGDGPWRNRTEFLTGREAIAGFLLRKWQMEFDYRVIKEVWTFNDNRIAVRLAYEWRDEDYKWFRSYGNENWEFDNDGFMCRRIASFNDTSIKESERKFHWPLGRRPDGHPSLSDLGL